MAPYSPELAREVCERMGCGESLRSMVREGLCNLNDVWRWRQKDPEFDEAYERARDRYIDSLFELMVDKVQMMQSEMAEMDADRARAHAQATRVEVDTYKWILGRAASGRWKEAAQQAASQLPQFIVVAAETIKPTLEHAPGRVIEHVDVSVSAHGQPVHNTRDSHGST